MIKVLTIGIALLTTINSIKFPNIEDGLIATEGDSSSSQDKFWASNYCPVAPVTDLNVDLFMGDWYQLYHTKSASWLEGVKDLVVTYKNRDNYWMDIDVALEKTGIKKFYHGTGRFIDGNKIGKVYEVFGRNWIEKLFMRSLIKIVEVDYDNHHIIYFEYMTWYFKWESGCFVRHRHPNPSEEERAKLLQQASELTHIDIREFVRE